MHTGATGSGELQPRTDSAKMYLSNIECHGSEDNIADCSVSGGPEAGINFNDKVYCQWNGHSGQFYYYNVAKINCGKLQGELIYHYKSHRKVPSDKRILGVEFVWSGVRTSWLILLYVSCAL